MSNSVSGSDITDIDSVPCELAFHPDYNDETADLILLSADRTAFQVHSPIMKLASNKFKAMIDNDIERTEAQDEVLRVPETGFVLKTILDFVYPNKEVEPFFATTIAELAGVCHAAQKYALTGAIRTLRVYFLVSIDKYPVLEAFALAYQLSWEDVIKASSTATLALDLYSADARNLLNCLPTDVVMKLLLFHRDRRDILLSSFNVECWYGRRSTTKIQWEAIRAKSKYGDYCTEPSEHLVTNIGWSALKVWIALEMERAPNGSAIRRNAFWDKEEFAELWTTACTKCRINHKVLLVDKRKLQEEVIRVLDNLPKTI